MFTNTFEPMVGGLERSVADTHKELNDTGHFCRIVTPSFKGAEQSVGGVLRVPALTGFGEKDFSIPLPTTKRMEQWMEAIEPHIVHAHQPFLLGDTAMRIARLRRAARIYASHFLRTLCALPAIRSRAGVSLTHQYDNAVRQSLPSSDCSNGKCAWHAHRSRHSCSD
ncbi:MAG: glycosyltransferase [Candidatus Obscuribacterales bacterium]|nr:glycosyltransferase [Steroidobacteraceae bacterium]